MQQQKFEAIDYGNGAKLVAVFYDCDDRAQEQLFDADLYIKETGTWHRVQGVTGCSFQDAIDFLQSVAEAWGAERGRGCVYRVRISEVGIAGCEDNREEFQSGIE